ncbi:MAG: class IIb bacteriocin, lactobin A/cerein 7B family [Flavobacterium sp.]|nr:class IIb bacteriocin, lactobin A/cerein 7B family [Flavobacterium sp.]
MNLENLNLIDLNSQEIKSIEGGNPIGVGVAIGAGIWGIYTAIKSAAYNVGYFIGNNT